MSKASYIKYNCKFCNKEFVALKYRKRKVCSLSCNTKWSIKNAGFGAKKGEPRRGSPQSWKHTEVFKQRRKGEGNPYWKGDKVKRRALHSWIKLNFKKIYKCELCGTTRRDTFYDWSNKDHKYSRKREDWWVLCRSCHMRYDKEKLGCRVNLKKELAELDK